MRGPSIDARRLERYVTADVRAVEIPAVAVAERATGASEARAVVFVPSPRVWHRQGTPGGLSLLERQLKQLRTLGASPALLLVPADQPEPILSNGLGPVAIARVPRATSDLGAALAAAPALPHASLALSADRLVDLRVLRALADAGDTTFATVDGVRPEPVGWVQAADVARHGAAVTARARRLPLASLDPYSAELRGTAMPYVIASGTTAERRRAWDVLIDHVQKRSLDLPGQYFDTPFENFLVRRLAPTDVTPNQITLLTLVVACVVAGFFLHGWLRVGILLALVVGVLDGVDGKLARLKLATSKLGELEHVGDFFYESSWYLTLASYLASATARVGLWYAGLVLVACDLADSLLYFAAQRRTGKMLDELTPFDRRFRAIAGRRNIYVVIFVVGFFTGHATTAFLCVVAWAICTVAVHASRVAWLLATEPRPLRAE